MKTKNYEIKKVEMYRTISVNVFLFMYISSGEIKFSSKPFGKKTIYQQKMLERYLEYNTKTQDYNWGAWLESWHDVATIPEINSKSTQIDEIALILQKFYDNTQNGSPFLHEQKLALQAIQKLIVNKWVKFDYKNLSNRPDKYGKYIVCRKDGKIHLETWNGTGWAYNHNEIRYYADLINPVL